MCSFSEHNLHVVGYSTPIRRTLSLQELQPHLHSLPDQPDAIPYVTSYYAENWGFCLSHRQREQLPDGQYDVVIDSRLENGVLNYAELLIPATSADAKGEILLSTYICHPSMANNEISGPCVTTALAKWIAALQNRRYTYRIVFIPETIGSILYISRNLALLKQRVKAGFNISCVGDDRVYSYMPTRCGGTLSDRVALHVLGHVVDHFIQYTWEDRGSDERQYNAPGVDLPIASLFRSKYGEYPEYHTSLDDLSLISPQGLGGALQMLKTCLEVLECNGLYKTTVLCEPQLGKRGLYPTMSKKNSVNQEISRMMAILTYGDGQHDLITVAEKMNCFVLELLPLFSRLQAAGLVESVSH
jgi:aminopeptidase-like protein